MGISIIFLVFSVLGIILYSQNSNETDLPLMLVVHMGLPTLLLGLTMLATLFETRFMELAGLSISIPTVTIVYLTYLTEIFLTNTEMRA